jgi:hypothetical protein
VFICLSAFICGSIIEFLGVLGVLGGSVFDLILVLIFLASWRLGGSIFNSCFSFVSFVSFVVRL